MSYRDIKPVPTPAGDGCLLQRRQSKWFVQSNGRESALFAGKEMLLSRNEDRKTYRLCYLDMSHPARFTNSEAAKTSAPDFARAVLLTMLQHVGVREDDRSLNACLLSSGR